MISHHVQLDAMDCNPTCLRMIAKYYDKTHTPQNFHERCFIIRKGVSLLGISAATEYIGFRTIE